MGMSVQKKFICGLVSFVLFVFIIGFIIGFFGCPDAEDKSCCGAKNGNGDTSGRLFEQEALEHLSGQKIRHYLKYFANQPNFAGTNDSCTQALYINKEWNSFGLDTVQLKRYDVLLSYLKRPSTLSLTDNNGTEVYSSILIENFTTTENDSRTNILFSTYSASGEALGKLLYINYGRDSDFKYLDDSNISCSGMIVIIRHGKIPEGTKVINALKWNAVGVLLYADPADYASNATVRNFTGTTWYPRYIADSRGLWENRGDLLTPGYPATAGIYRESVDDIPLPKIPVQPISLREAETLLRILNHTKVPKHWQGGLDFSYGIQLDQRDTRKVTINVSLSLVKRPVCDVVGTIKGNIEPDRYVLLGSRRPLGGTAVIMEVARILLSIRKKGWLPRRSIKICSWGAGEYGNMGSVEWIEEYEKILETRAIAYINVDRAVQETFVIRSSPLLEGRVLEAAKKVTIPPNKSETLYDEWKKTNHEKTGQQPGLLSNDRGSGCLPFAYRIGIPCVDLTYQPDKAFGNYPAHHPFYDTPDTLKYYTTLAQVSLRMTFDIAGSVFIPFDVVRYAGAFCRFALDLSANYNGTLNGNNITLDFLLNASQDLLAAAKTFQNCLHAQDKNDVLQVRMINDRLLQLDRAFVNKEGLPGRPFLRHVILAPRYFDTESESKFPGVTDSIHTARDSGKRKDWERVKKQISMVIHAFRSAVSVLQPPDF